jgi:hypothetical protein
MTTMGEPAVIVSAKECGSAQDRHPIGSGLPVGGIATLIETFCLFPTKW